MKPVLEKLHIIVDVARDRALVADMVEHLGECVVVKGWSAAALLAAFVPVSPHGRATVVLTLELSAEDREVAVKSLGDAEGVTCVRDGDYRLFSLYRDAKEGRLRARIGITRDDVAALFGAN